MVRGALLASLLGMIFGALPVVSAIFFQRRMKKKSGAVIGLGYLAGLVGSILLMSLLHVVGLNSNLSAYFVTLIASHMYFVFKEILRA